MPIRAESELMDYYEFMERSGDKVSREEYEKIETVYLNHPLLKDVPDMLDFWKENGKMKAIDLLYPICKIVASLQSEINGVYKRDIALNRDFQNLSKRFLESESIINLYRSMVDENTVKGMVTLEEAEKALIARKDEGDGE